MDTGHNDFVGVVGCIHGCTAVGLTQRRAARGLLRGYSNTPIIRGTDPSVIVEYRFIRLPIFLRGLDGFAIILGSMTRENY